MDATRVRLLEDGTSSSDVSDIGPDHGIPIDPLSARSIEVVRGAATLRYGSQAIGGVVNTINNRVPMSLPKEAISAKPARRTPPSTRAPKPARWSMARPGSSRSMPMASGARPTTTTRRRHPAEFLVPRLGRLGRRVLLPGDGKSHVGLAVTHYDAQYGIPSDTTYIDMRQTKVMSRNSFDLGTGLLKTLTLDGSYGDYQHRRRTPTARSTPPSRTRNGTAAANCCSTPSGRCATRRWASNTSTAISRGWGGQSYLNPATSQNIAGYLFTEIQLASAACRGQRPRRACAHHRHPGRRRFTSRDFTPVSGPSARSTSRSPGSSWASTSPARAARPR
jgi:iron complex outermembrane receptor protein